MKKILELFDELDKRLSGKARAFGARHKKLTHITAHYGVHIITLIAVIEIIALFIKYPSSVLGYGIFLAKIALNIVLIWGLSALMGMLIGRKRPFVQDANITPFFKPLSRSSFPSRHSVYMSAVAGAFLFLSYPIGILLLAIAIISGLSRAASGVHFVFDVLVGIVVGFGGTLLFTKVSFVGMFVYIVLGSVQGLTEFLPVSSSGHLYLLEYYFGIGNGLMLTLILHMASLAAVLVYFRKKIFMILIALLRFLHEHTLVNNTDAELGLKIAFATLATFPTALLIKKLGIFEQLTPNIVALTLVITAVAILVAEYTKKKDRTFSWGLALLLGLIQGITVVPGISRSGMTIALLIFAGVSRKLSAEISFLLAIPTIIGAFVFELLDVSVLPVVYIGHVLAFVVAFVVSLFSIRFMLDWVEGKWKWFALYCAVLAFAIVLF